MAHYPVQFQAVALFLLAAKVSGSRFPAQRDLRQGSSPPWPPARRAYASESATRLKHIKTYAGFLNLSLYN